MIKHPQKNRALRVLHCHSVVGGNSTWISRAEALAGADSRVYALNVTPFFDETYTNGIHVLSRSGDSLFKREIMRWYLLWVACWWADVVHFSFGGSIFPWVWGFRTRHTGFGAWCYSLYAKLLGNWDIILLRLLRKRIFVTYQGDDARQSDYCKLNFSINPSKIFLSVSKLILLNNHFFSITFYHSYLQF